MNRHSILFKVCVLSIGSVIVTAGILLACVMWQKQSLESTITTQLQDAIRRQVSETSQTVYRMVEGADLAPVVQKLLAELDALEVASRKLPFLAGAPA